VTLLGDAEAALDSPTLNDAWSRLSLSDLRTLVADSRSAIAEQRLSETAAAELWRAFPPTCDWDDIGGDTSLGNAIFELVDALYGRPLPQ
jgi:hypothetical protein